MADATIKHFIAIRFFTWQDSRYPHNIFDVDFLLTQLALAKNNCLRSLEKQTNKNFELVFCLNPKFFDEPKYEFIFSTLKSSTSLPITFIKGNMSPLVKKSCEHYDFVIQSRIDFDDFIFKDAVADTQSKVSECENVLIYGYCKGYEYINGELYNHDRDWGGLGHLAILQSLILKSSFAKSLHYIHIYHFGHSQCKLNLKDVVEENGFNFSESMFQQNLSIKAYIYFRSEFSHHFLSLNPGKSISELSPNIPKITSADITKKQLEEEFAFHYELKSIK